MIGTHEAHVASHDNLDEVAWDLATVSGALSEIATTWRRARPCRPDLPLDLPQQLADMAKRLAADARSLAGTEAGTGQEGTPSLERSVAIRLSALSEGAEYARAITSRGGAAAVGDAELWEFLRPALRRTGHRYAFSALPADSGADSGAGTDSGADSALSSPR